MNPFSLPSSKTARTPLPPPVEILARTILRREKLGLRELPRCRHEVRLQLIYAPPLPESPSGPDPTLAPVRDWQRS